MSQSGSGGMHRELKLLIVGLILGVFSILVASSFRDLIDSFIQLTVPVTDRALSGGYLFLWRLFYFILILALLIIASICLV